MNASATRVMIVGASARERTSLGRALGALGDVQLQSPAIDQRFALEAMKHAMPDVVILNLRDEDGDPAGFVRQVCNERGGRLVVRAVAGSAAAARAGRCIGPGVQLALSSAGDQESAAWWDQEARRLACLINPPGGSARTVAANSAAFAARPAAMPRAMPATRPAAVARAGLHEPASLLSQAAAGSAGGPVAEPSPESATTAAFGGRLIAIGASAGGTQALQHVLPALGERCPPVVIVQHMPDGFTALFAQSVQRICGVRVREATDGERLERNLILIAPAGRQLRVVRMGEDFRVALGETDLVAGHCPAVDVLFASVARSCGGQSAGFVLTGMGSDGAQGLREMRRAGAVTYVQDEATSTVWGMPKAALEMGGALHQVPLEAVAPAILQYL